eukprot:CAMPEP_0114667740 /NCGR_PEP_ID=MMETSP0191-20121206/35092_1 /TAXON_ID=126664 /ORGANISM="Sorites sp." /LENGTH=234 /DNA_ID=CAMNT_0001919149 /DNA_START=46 /DNA_END=750 /DNA_ORIENTATION=+
MTVRVLCLHGWRTNPSFMEKQMKNLMAKLPGWDFSFLPGPVCGMLAADDDVEQESLAPYFQWWEPLDGTAGQLEAVRYVAQHLRQEGPFDVLLGFSEGAACAALLLATIMGAGKASPGAEMQKELEDVPRPQLFVSVCGIPPDDEATGCCFARPRPKVVKAVEVPSVHLLGDLDADKTNSLTLAKEWFNVDDSQILRHPHGHRFPLDCRPLADAMRQAVQAVRQDVGRASLGGC